MGLTGTQVVVTEALAGGGGGGREGHRSGRGGLPLFSIFNIGNLSLFCSPQGRTGGTEALRERKRVLWCHRLYDACTRVSLLPALNQYPLLCHYCLI